ncbi:hypothetical protein SMJ63A_10078 [Stenotrophomonas geniculata]
MRQRRSKRHPKAANNVDAPPLLCYHITNQTSVTRITGWVASKSTTDQEELPHSVGRPRRGVRHLQWRFLCMNSAK